jgi:hypothetical protein
VNPRAAWPESRMALEWAAASSTMSRQLALHQNTQGRPNLGFSGLGGPEVALERAWSEMR